jgi:tRNA nucleotidyltransferase/poly(A) polymerase
MNAAPKSTREDALSVVRRLRSAGHEAYFAGGCVRDMLLGLPPKDYDVATDAPPPKVRELFPRTQAVGAAFGVILVRQRSSQVEVATFRTDGKYLDGRRPEGVVFTTAEEDAKRRDFTINGLFFDPIDEKFIDYVGGQADLQARTLRAIGNPDERFEEDHLRVLRAVRFAARFGLTIEPGTWDAIGRHAGRVIRISPERVADELRLMLTPPSRAAAWDMLVGRDFDPVLFRFVKPAPQRERQRFLERVRAGRPIPFGLALAAGWLDGFPLAKFEAALDAPAVQQLVAALRQSLRLSNEESEAVHGSLEGLRLLLFTRPAHGVAMLKRFLARPTARLSRDLLAAVPGQDALEARLAELEKTDYAPPPLITGDDLTAAGLKPGRVFKRALDEAYDAQLEGRVATRQQALESALKVARAK